MVTGNQKDLREYLKNEYGIDVTKQAISLIVKNKDYRLRFTQNGKIIIDESAKLLSTDGFGKRSKIINKKKEALQKRAKKQEIKPPSKEEFEEDIDSEGPLKITDSRVRIENHKAFHQAEKERINNEKSTRELIPLTDITDHSFNLWRQVRDSIQSIKDRCAIKVRAAESDHEAEQILNEEAHRILSSIVEKYENLDDDDLKKKLAQRLVK